MMDVEKWIGENQRSLLCNRRALGSVATKVFSVDWSENPQKAKQSCFVYMIVSGLSTIYRKGKRLGLVRMVVVAELEECTQNDVVLPGICWEFGEALNADSCLPIPKLGVVYLAVAQLFAHMVARTVGRVKEHYMTEIWYSYSYLVTDPEAGMRTLAAV